MSNKVSLEGIRPELAGMIRAEQRKGVEKAYSEYKVESDGGLRLEELLHPDLFAKGLMKMSLYDWQCSALRDAELPWGKTAVCACNGSGKTSTVIVPFILWHMLMFPGSRTVITAKQERQITHSLMDALKIFSPMLSQFSPDWKESELILHFNSGKNAGKKSKMLGFTTNEGARFESFHNLPGSPLAIVVDECKEISDDIFVAVDRCDPLRRLYASSPSNNPVGRFHQIVTENPENYKLHFVSAFKCPHLRKEYIEDKKKQYGEDSAIYRSMILGLPTEDNSDCVFSASAVDMCMAGDTPKFIDDGNEVVFIDWSTGGDEIVVAHRRGNKVTIPLAFTTDRNAVTAGDEIIGRVAECLRSLGMNKGNNKYIYADDDGIGWRFNNQLNQMGWNISLFRGGSAAFKKSHYKYKIHQAWYDCADIVKRNGVILPNDKTLRFQLVGRKKVYDTNNPTILKLQKKNELPHSPDRADAVIGCIFNGPRVPEEMKEVKKVVYDEDLFEKDVDKNENFCIRESSKTQVIGMY